MINIFSLAFSGIEIIEVEVQVHISKALPAFTIVGLADKTVAESRERVRAALSSIGIALPAQKILVNLAPADLIKEGSHFDLAIACALLASIGVLPPEEIQEYLLLGELSLNGSIVAVSGVLPASVGAVARNKGIICPYDNGKEAAWSGNDRILAPKHLLELINHFQGKQVLATPVAEVEPRENYYLNLKDIKGQPVAKRALEIAASGRHSLLMYGPPGAGKSMLAQRINGILPKMASQEILECSAISSMAGTLSDGKLTDNRPFRSPHHSCSIAAMVGGGISRRIKPGEISLAHNGVLFLDELPEFSSNVIDSLRQPIESGEVVIARANAHVKYPAKFQLIAAMNPCKCGYLGNDYKECSKAPKCGSDYQSKISGPMMDRFDLHVHVKQNPIYHNEVVEEEDSEVVAKRVLATHQLQRERYDKYSITTNSELDGQKLLEYAFPHDSDAIDLLKESSAKLQLSMRSHNKILKVARTIADMEQSKYVLKHHIAESLYYRNLNMK